MSYFKLDKVINYNGDYIALNISSRDNDTNFIFLELPLEIKHDIVKDILYIKMSTHYKKDYLYKVLDAIGLSKASIILDENNFCTSYITIINRNTFENLITLWKLKGVEMKGF